MRKTFFLLLVILTVTAAQTFATDWYVRKGATGSNSGSDWNNAWNEMSQIKFSSLSCGDTVWLAGGSYTTSLSGSKSCTSGNELTFRRVLATDSAPTLAAGWNSGFDSRVVLPNISVPGPAAYMTFDGRQWQGTAGSAGIQVLIPGSSGDGIDASNTGSSGPAIDHITWTYVEVFGPACVESQNCSGGGVIGVNIMPYCSTANRTNLLFDHVSVHRTGEAFRGCGWDHNTIQYSYIYDTHNDGQQHEDIEYSNPPYQNVTWRYNHIFQSPNDGIFFEYSTSGVNWQFYGNVYYHSGGAIISCKSGTTCGPWLIYNNVFENDTQFGDYQPGWVDFGGSMAAGTQVYNNIWENIRFQNANSNVAMDYNAYNSGNSKDGGAHSFSYDPGTLGASLMFLNEAPSNPVAGDFHLTAAGLLAFGGKGKNLGAPYSTDAEGNTCSSTATACNLGMFQSSSASTSNPPAPPSNLSALVQ